MFQKFKKFKKSLFTVKPLTMNEKDEEEYFNFGSEFDRYVPPPPKICKLSSQLPMPENLTASFQNLLNKRSNTIVAKKRQNLQECFTILKFFFIFVIFITTCKIITLFFTIKERVENQWTKNDQKTIIICFYLIFGFALIVQLIQLYAIIFNRLCLSIVFTVLEFIIIILAMIDVYNSKDEHWLIFVWLIGLFIFVLHLVLLHKMKKRLNNKKKKINEQNNIRIEIDQSYQQFEQDSYSDYNKNDYSSQTNIDMPNIKTEFVFDESVNTDTNLNFVNDEEEAHENREKLCKELLRQCQMKIYDLEMSQCNNQILLDEQKENCETQESITSTFNSPKSDTSTVDSPKSIASTIDSSKSNSSSCDDENCKETSEIILNSINSNLEFKYNCQDYCQKYCQE